MISALRLVGRLPRPIRKGLRTLVGGAGHSNHWTHALWAWHHAREARRLDRLAPRVVAWIAASRGDIDGASCLDFGTGHLLSEALVFWLAGANRVVAVDSNPILRWRFTRRAFARADRDVLREELLKITPRERVDERLRLLSDLDRWTPERLANLGIHYHAPLDFSLAPPFHREFDFIHSAAVLEHVPASRVDTILANLHAALRPGGTMVHSIHMEDHLDFQSNPFAYLAADTDWRESDADSRGNRLRASDWIAAFARLPDAQVKTLWDVVREDAPLPEPLDRAFAGYDRRDLRVGGLLLAVDRV